MNETEKNHRPIRSYVLRSGRMTTGQEQAFEQLWSIYGLNIEVGTQLKPEALFANQCPIYLEIGFGDGEALLETARNNPGNGYIGIEVHRPGVGHLLLKLEQEGVQNVRIISHDAMEILRHHLPPECLNGIMLFFPDPWHKKKHHKRRIVQPEFAQLCAHLIKPDGILHMATDWEHYAEQMMTVLSADESFENIAGAGCFSPRPAARPLTKFERRGHRLGHGVWDLLFRRK